MSCITYYLIIQDVRVVVVALIFTKGGKMLNDILPSILADSTTFSNSDTKLHVPLQTLQNAFNQT